MLRGYRCTCSSFVRQCSALIIMEATKRSAEGAGSHTAKAKKRRMPPMTQKRLKELFSLLGVANQAKISNCLKAAILNGHIKLKDPKDDPTNEYGLDQAITQGECFMCDKELTCRVRDVLYQPDIGHDFEVGGSNATFHCKNTEECVGIYVTDMCSGNPAFDSGSFHNHCSRHPKCGYCVGDYREIHCDRCNMHTHGLPCYNCDGSESGSEDCSDDDCSEDDSSDAG